MFVEALLPIGSAFDNITRQNRMIDRMEKNNEIAQQRLDVAKQNTEIRKQQSELKQQTETQRAEDRHNLALQQQTLNAQRIEKNEMYLSSKRAGYAQTMEDLETAFSRGGVHLQIPPQ